MDEKPPPDPDLDAQKARVSELVHVMSQPMPVAKKPRMAKASAGDRKTRKRSA